MAKENEKSKLEDDSSEDVGTTQKKSADSKQNKQSNESKLPLPLIIGGALGGVIMIIVSVIIGTVIANKLFPPVEPQIIAQPAAEEKEVKQKERISPVPDEEDIGDINSLLADSDWLYFNSGKQQSNTRGATKLVCILEVGITYKPYHTEILTERGFLIGNKDGDGFSGVDTNSTIYNKFKQVISSQLISFISSHSSDELQVLQSNQALSESIKTHLKKSFQETGLVLGKVDITNFLIVQI